jgi:hypothetical protein
MRTCGHVTGLPPLILHPSFPGHFHTKILQVQLLTLQTVQIIVNVATYLEVSCGLLQYQDAALK